MFHQLNDIKYAQAQLSNQSTMIFTEEWAASLSLLPMGIQLAAVPAQ